MVLTSQQEAYLLTALESGSVKIYDFTSSHPLVQEGWLERSTSYTFTLTPTGTVEAQSILAARSCGGLVLLTSGGIPILINGMGWSLEDEDDCPLKYWKFTYQVNYPRMNSDLWSFDWEVLATGINFDEAERWADQRIEEIFPGATIGEV